MAQYQTTIFGTEEECKATCPVAEQILSMVVDMSERTSLPIYVPKNGKGTWYMSVNGVQYAKARGTQSGLTSDWEVFEETGILSRGMVTVMVNRSFSQMVGTCLMDGKAIKVVGVGVDYLEIKAFGILGDTTKNALRYYRREDGRWSK